MNELLKDKDRKMFENCKKTIVGILEAIKVETFINPQDISDAEAMGLLVSKFFEWDGVDILETSQVALEEADFHTEAGQVSDMLSKYYGDE